MTASIPTRLFLLFVPFALLAWSVFGTSSQEFEIGGYYRVTQFRPLERPGEGVLLKVTDEWIVLGGFLSEGRCEEGYSLIDLCCCTIWNAMTPEHFGLHVEMPRQTVKQDRPGKPNILKMYTWIPRRGIQSIERVQGDITPIFKTLIGDSPSLQSTNTVHVLGYDRDDAVKQISIGERVEISAGEVSVVPIESQPKVPLRDVCSIVQLVPFADFWKLQVGIE